MLPPGLCKARQAYRCYVCSILLVTAALRLIVGSLYTPRRDSRNMDLRNKGLERFWENKKLKRSILRKFVLFWRILEIEPLGPSPEAIDHFVWGQTDWMDGPKGLDGRPRRSRRQTGQTGRTRWMDPHKRAALNFSFSPQLIKYAAERPQKAYF